MLEVLQILEGEINLREETRVAGAGARTVPADDHKSEAVKPSGTQAELKERVDKVIEADSRAAGRRKRSSAKEIQLLGMVFRRS